MTNRKTIHILAFCFLFFNLSFAQAILINEVMSSNDTTIIDEDGNTPDWIELYNAGSEAVDLNGFGITDDTAVLFKWVFPQKVLEPQSYLLVFASGKNRSGAGQWETIINWGDAWHYFVPQQELPENWRLPGYDDSGWPVGPSGFGYGDDDDGTITNPSMSVYIRLVFSVDQLPGILEAVMHVDYDDGFVAYLNGQEIARANIGVPGTIPAYDDSASIVTEPVICYGVSPGAFPVDPALLLPSSNVLAIEVHNYNITSSDLTLIPFFSLLLESPPPNPSGTPPLLGLINPKLHTSFKISASGETILLTNPSGIIADSVSTGFLPTDVSKGRQPDGSGNWRYFTESTPEISNTTQSWPGITGIVRFSQPGGFYTNSIQVSLSTDNPDDIIYFSLTGDEPGEAGTVYQNPLNVFETTVIRAVAVHEGYLPSSTATSTYFIGTDHDLPVISLATAPANLFDPVTGIYHDDNVWQDWERPIHVEFFEPDDSPGFSLDAGVKIYGGWTRTLPQKSLAIYARGSYGYDEVDYKLFPDLDIDKFESFVLRNSGNDWLNTMFRDGLMTGLVAGDGIDIAAFRPAAVYINGDYWGLYNIREKLSDRYIEDHHGVDHDSIDILEFDGSVVIKGDNIHYNNMIAFIQNNPLSDAANYEYVKTQMDIENFISYEITQIFIANTDWPGNNIKFWRPKTPEGRWKWMLYDTDFGFGLATDYTHNTLTFATDPAGPDWPNPPWSTFLLRQLLTNYEFRFDFINRYADLLNSSFITDREIDQINLKKLAILNEMPNQFNRWGSNMWDWLNNVQVLRNFATERRINVQNHVIQYFDLTDFSEVELNTEPYSAGTIKISTLTLEDFPWTGEYFNGVPVKLTTTASPGFRFLRWEGEVESDSNAIAVIFTGNASLTSVFEAYTPDTIVINEINYNSAVDFNPGDWVEFYNPNGYAVDLSNWVFKDEDDAHAFTIPEETVIDSNGYFIVCEDTAAFHGLFPRVTNYIGNVRFGLSGNGELTRLYDPSGLLIDTVHYDDVAPWPVEPDGNGPTLELIDPALDNALPESWMASGQHGTPGSENGIYVSIEDVHQTDEFEFNACPNPFRERTNFIFISDKEPVVSLKIYNSLGGMVMAYPRIKLSGGTRHVAWNGTDLNGTPLPVGIYICHLTSGNLNLTWKLIKVK